MRKTLQNSIAAEECYNNNQKENIETLDSFRNAHSAISTLLNTLELSTKSDTFEGEPLDFMQRNTTNLLNNFRSNMTEMQNEFKDAMLSFKNGQLSTIDLESLLDAEQKKGFFTLELAADMIKFLEGLFTGINEVFKKISTGEPVLLPEIQHLVGNLDQSMDTVIGISRVVSSGPKSVMRAMNVVEVQKKDLAKYADKGHFTRLMQEVYKGKFIKGSAPKEMSYQDAMAAFSRQDSAGSIFSNNEPLSPGSTAEGTGEDGDPYGIAGFFHNANVKVHSYQVESNFLKKKPLFQQIVKKVGRNAIEAKKESTSTQAVEKVSGDASPPPDMMNSNGKMFNLGPRRGSGGLKKDRRISIPSTQDFDCQVQTSGLINFCTSRIFSLSSLDSYGINGKKDLLTPSQSTKTKGGGATKGESTLKTSSSSTATNEKDPEATEASTAVSSSSKKTVRKTMLIEKLKNKVKSGMMTVEMKLQEVTTNSPELVAKMNEKFNNFSERFGALEIKEKEIRALENFNKRKSLELDLEVASRVQQLVMDDDRGTQLNELILRMRNKLDVKMIDTSTSAIPISIDSSTEIFEEDMVYLAPEPVINYIHVVDDTDPENEGQQHHPSVPETVLIKLLNAQATNLMKIIPLIASYLPLSPPSPQASISMSSTRTSVSEISTQLSYPNDATAATTGPEIASSPVQLSHAPSLQLLTNLELDDDIQSPPNSLLKKPYTAAASDSMYLDTLLPTALPPNYRSLPPIERRESQSAGVLGGLTVAVSVTPISSPLKKFSSPSISDSIIRLDPLSSPLGPSNNSQNNNRRQYGKSRSNVSILSTPSLRNVGGGGGGSSLPLNDTFDDDNISVGTNGSSATTLNRPRENRGKSFSKAFVETIVIYPVNTANKYTNTDINMTAVDTVLDVSTLSPLSVVLPPTLHLKLSSSENPLLLLYETYKNDLSELAKSRFLSAVSGESNSTNSLPILGKVFTNVTQEMEKLRTAVTSVDCTITSCEESLRILTSGGGGGGGDNTIKYEERRQEQGLRLFNDIGSVSSSLLLLQLQFSEYRTMFERLIASEASRLPRLLQSCAAFNESYQIFVDCQGKLRTQQGRLLDLKGKCQRIYRQLPQFANNADGMNSSNNNNNNNTSSNSSSGNSNGIEKLEKEIVILRSEMERNGSYIHQLEEELREAEMEIDNLEREVFQTSQLGDRTPAALLFFSMLQEDSALPSIQQVVLQLGHFKSFIDGSEHIDFPTLRKRLTVCVDCVPNIQLMLSRYNQMYQKWMVEKHKLLAQRRLSVSSNTEVCPLCLLEIRNHSTTVVSTGFQKPTGESQKVKTSNKSLTNSVESRRSSVARATYDNNLSTGNGNGNITPMAVSNGGAATKLPFSDSPPLSLPSSMTSSNSEQGPPPPSSLPYMSRKSISTKK